MIVQDCDSFEGVVLSQVSKDAIEAQLALAKEVRRKGAIASTASEEKMVIKHASKNPPSVYQIGDEVLVQYNKNKACNKITGKGVSAPQSYKGEVTECKIKTNRYKLSIEVDGKCVSEWFSVSKMSSVTRAEEKKRKKNIDGECDGFGMLLCYLINSY